MLTKYRITETLDLSQWMQYDLTTHQLGHYAGILESFYLDSMFTSRDINE